MHRADASTLPGILLFRHFGAEIISARSTQASGFIQASASWSRVIFGSLRRNFTIATDISLSRCHRPYIHLTMVRTLCAALLECTSLTPLMEVTPGYNYRVCDTINNKPDIRVPSAAYGVDRSAHTTLKIRINHNSGYGEHSSQLGWVS